MNNLKYFKNKNILITGGTGSFGNAMVKKIIKSEIKQIRIFSRDEKKQDDMRKYFNNSKLKFFLGDIRDINSIKNAMESVDYVFHAAALKQVPSCEFFPLEAVKTNIIGTENLLSAAIESNVKKIICLSTDKAVAPINSMGLSKSMMEKVIIAKSRELYKKNISVCITRYGNVISSRGSVIPLFIDQIKSKKPLTITNQNMTRFMMSLEDAIQLVLFAFINGKNGEIFIKKSPAATIDTVAKSLENIFSIKCKRKIIGLRHGEKFHETLMSKEEKIFAKEYKEYFKIFSDTRDLNYEKFYSRGTEQFSNLSDYSSENTNRLTVKNLVKILKPILNKHN